MVLPQSPVDPSVTTLAILLAISMYTNVMMALFIAWLIGDLKRPKWEGNWMFRKVVKYFRKTTAKPLINK